MKKQDSLKRVKGIMKETLERQVEMEFKRQDGAVSQHLCVAVQVSFCKTKQTQGLDRQTQNIQAAEE